MRKRLFLCIVIVAVLLVPSGAVWAEEPAADEETALQGVIAYPVFDNDKPQMKYNIWLLDLETGKKKLWLANASQPAFSHDGKSIAFKDWTEDQKVYGLYAASLDNMDGSLWRFSDSLSDQTPKWSTDDAFFYYTSRRESDRLERPVVTESVWTGGHTILRPDLDNKEILGKSPAVVMVKKDTYDILYQGCEGSNCGIMKRHMNGTNLVQVTDGTTDQALSVSPDSKQIAFMAYSRDDDWEIYVMDADGSNVTRLTRNPGSDGLPTWSPDGKWIAFVREKTSESNDWSIMAVMPDGTGEQKIADIGMLNGKVMGTTPDQCKGWWEEQISWGSVKPY